MAKRGVFTLLDAAALVLLFVLLSFAAFDVAEGRPPPGSSVAATHDGSAAAKQRPDLVAPNLAVPDASTVISATAGADQPQGDAYSSSCTHNRNTSGRKCPPDSTQHP